MFASRLKFITYINKLVIIKQYSKIQKQNLKIDKRFLVHKYPQRIERYVALQKITNIF
jgi:hypothetical protein